MNGGSANQWLESFSVPKETNGEQISVTAIVKHDVGTSLLGLAVDDDWNGTDNTSSLVAEGGGVVTTIPFGAANYSAIRYTFTPLNQPGFSCVPPFGGTRRVNNTLRIRAVMSDGQRTGVATANVHSVENNQCAGPDDYPYLFNQSQGASQITPGTTVAFTFRGDDVDASGTNDRFEKMSWRVRRLNDGVITQGPVNVGGLSDNTNVNLNVQFPQRGRYVVEAELGGEDDGFGAFANAGRFFRIGAVDVNSPASTSPTVSLTPSATTVQAGGSFTVSATVSDAADLNGRVQMIRWDLDGNGVFEQRELASDETTGLTGNQLMRTATTTAGSCADRTIGAEVTDNGAMNAADNIRRIRPTSTTVIVNCPPVANNDAYGTAEDTPLVVAAPGVLGNDADGDGNTLTAQLVSGPASGTLVLNSTGGFTYTPATNFNGTVTFTYRATDGSSQSSPATVTITVVARNDAPVAANDVYSTVEDTTLNVAAPGVLGNDTDVDGNSLSAVLAGGPAHGTLTLNADGSFTYTPTANFSGTDVFTYRASDGSAQSDVATVTISIAANAAPTAADDSYVTDEDVVLTVAPPGVLGNDTDPEGDPLSAILVSGPIHGTLTLNADGSFSYSPGANYFGPDSFTYKANDGDRDSNVATVSLTINAVNDPPVAANDSYTTAEDVLLTVAAPGVLGNDSDVDGDSLVAVLVSGPSHGALTLNADGSFSYSPAANYSGPDSFTYKASDGELDSDVATVSLTITPVNDAPICQDGSASIPESSSLSSSVSCADIENDPLTHSVVADPLRGSVVMNPDGSFTYTPVNSFVGNDSFGFRANDGDLNSAIAVFTITMTDVLPPKPTVTKTANPTSVPAPGGVGVGQVDYTISVRHPANAVEPVQIMALNDSAFGDLNGQGTCVTGAILQPGQSYTCTFTGVVSGPVGSTHTNTATATVHDDEGNLASGSGSATVTVVTPTAKVSPTFTTCNQYSGGSAQDLNEIRYVVQNGKISAVSGQLLYFSKITATSPNFTLDVAQTRTVSGIPLFGVQAAQTKFYDSLCRVSPKGSITITPNGSNVHIAVTGALPNEVFYVAVMYNPSTTVGTAVSQPYPSSIYRFSTLRNSALIPSSRESIVFRP